MSHRVTLTILELKLLEELIAPVKPQDHDPKAYAILRSLYGRFITLRMKKKNYGKFSPTPQ